MDIVKSYIPEKQSMSLYNLFYEKRYSEVIEQGLIKLDECNEDAGVHLALMDAYFKLRNENEENIVACAKHAKLAIIYGHNTGHAHDRLLKTLKTLKHYYQALQLCDLVLKPDFAFWNAGADSKDNYAKAKEQITKLLPKATDTPKDVLFSKEQIKSIISAQKERLRLKREGEKLFKQADKAYWAGNDNEYKRLMKAYRDIQEVIW